MWLLRSGGAWCCEGRRVPPDVGLGALLRLRAEDMRAALAMAPRGDAGPPERVVELDQEVWACGVTYLRSRVEREAESESADVYAKVYGAERPEIFFKAIGRRVVGTGEPIRIRRDSTCNVPEPELTLVVNAHAEIVGYAAGNDVSSRSIEGENPLYLPQAKSYEGSCAIGPAIVLATVEEMADMPITLQIDRGGATVFQGSCRTSDMKRGLDELVGYLFRELDFPNGVFLMTGTGIVPPHPFTLLPGDVVEIGVGVLTLRNEVALG